MHTFHRGQSLQSLVIEHDPDQTSLLRTILTKMGISVRAAENATKAQAALTNQAQFNLIVLDLSVPGMDGFQFLESLKTHPRLRRTPVLVYSEANDETSVIKAVELGAAGFVAKPLEQENFVTKVQQLVNRDTVDVLLVDDDEVMIGLLQRIISRAGYTVKTAPSGKAALALIEESTFHLVITDIDMPEMDGLQLLEQIRSTQSKLPVVLITGKSEKHGRLQAMHAGAIGYISIPFKNTDIIQTISSLI